MEPATPKKPKTAVADFTLRLGPLMVGGRLVPVAVADKVDEAAYKLITPDTHEAVNQFYVGQSIVNDETIPRAKMYTQGQLGRGKLVDDKLVPVPQEEIDKAAESSLPNNVIDITVHPADEVADSMWHGAQAYVFYPKLTDVYHATLLALLKGSEYAFVGLAAVKKQEGLYRVRVWRDTIVVEKMRHPEDLNPVVQLAPELPNQQLLEAAQSMLAAVAVPFEPTAYSNKVRARHQQLNEAIKNGQTFEIESPHGKDNVVDLLSALQGFSQAKKGKPQKLASKAKVS